MDRGREIDKAQNLNARYIDSFNCSSKTSVKTTNPPGKISSNIKRRKKFFFFRLESRRREYQTDHEQTQQQQ